MAEYDLDILTSNGFSDMLFGLKSYQPEVYKYSHRRSPEQIKQDVFLSRRVQHIIAETAKDKSQTVAQVQEEAKAILDEMGHNFSLKTIRFMAYLLRKILTSLFRKVMVNKSGLEKLKEASVHNPVVLVPSHRSYMDFLLVSFICFSVDLPLPFIAAAQDFMNMRVVRRLFRKSGAFFMRRSFMADKLYWVIFTEYVQNQLQRGEQPLEFFLEGTRSRTGKFLHPRLGLLSMVVDLYANAGVPNILLCPISISYERVIEEPLFAYELLGIPKPRESLRGLIKSRSVLYEDYGSIYVNFGDLIPLSSCIEGKLDRMSTACIPRHLLLYLTDEEKEVVRQLGYEITVRLQSHMVVTPSVTVAAIMLQNQQGLPLDELVRKYARLQECFKSLDVSLAPNNYGQFKDAVLESITFQKNCLEIDLNGLVRIKDPESISEAPHKTSATSHAIRKRDHVISSVQDVMDEAAIQIQLAYKRNTLLPYFFGIGMVTLAAQRQTTESKDLRVLSDDFDFLSGLLIKEVAGLAESLHEVFEKTLDTMTNVGMITINRGDNVTETSMTQASVTLLNHASLEFASGLWLPFLVTYWIACDHLVKNAASGVEHTIHELVQGAQHLAAEYVLSGNVRFYEVLSLELLKNATKTVMDLNDLKKIKRPGKDSLVTVSDQSTLLKFHQRIGGFLGIKSDATSISSQASKL